MEVTQVNVPVRNSNETTREKISRYYTRMRKGVITPLEFAFFCLGRGFGKVFGHKLFIADRMETSRQVKALKSTGNITNEFYRFKDVRIPILDAETETAFFHHVFNDTFYCYLNLYDNYRERELDELWYVFQEGAYGLINDKVNVRVEPGDIVIDAGGWVGDFAAYASAKGAVTYSFEPSEEGLFYLNKTAQLNKNIIPVKKGLSDENVKTAIFVDSANTARTSLNKTEASENSNTASSSVETVRLDDFVRENNLPRVDFIKSNIEGFERYLLAGAQETLAHFAPKLALCTYHLPDDPEVMTSLILKANPKYNIVQKRMKLYASVPE